MSRWRRRRPLAEARRPARRWWVRLRRHRLSLGALGLVALLVLTRAAWLQAAANFLVTRDTLRPADAIVVLAGEQVDRVRYAVSLYRRGLAPKLLMSGGGRLSWREREAEAMAAYARHLGVPARDIWLEDRSLSTEENALFSAPILKARGVRTILLVTSDWHSRRATLVFRKVLKPHGITVISAPTPTEGIELKGWWRSGAAAERVMLEWAKFTWYVASGKIGLW